MTHSVRVTKEDANNYSRILTLLGMEEEGDPVEGVRQLQLALETLRSDHGVAWLLVDQHKDRLAELDLSETQLIQERDEREEVINALCDAVLGADRPEWSSAYSFEDAMEEVEVKTAVLDKEVSELYALRARVAELEKLVEVNNSVEKHLRTNLDAAQSHLEPLGFQTRRAIKAEDELRALQEQVERSRTK